jgi:hypothetical protein
MYLIVYTVCDCSYKDIHIPDYNARWTLHNPKMISRIFLSTPANDPVSVTPRIIKLDSRLAC